MFRKILFFCLTCFFLAFHIAAAEDPQFTNARRKMVETDLKGRDITDPKILEIMGRMPRHLFVEKSLQDKAYADHPLPIGQSQTISQPYVVALMTQALGIKPGEKVLEIGTGSGYQAAVLAELTNRVFTVEIRRDLAEKAAEVLKTLGYDRVSIRCGDGYLGWEEHAPFDAIMVTCAIGDVPPRLIQQLGEGGRLIIPLGSPANFQTLTLLTKWKGKIHSRQITGVSFVPMVDEKLKRR